MKKKHLFYILYSLAALSFFLYYLFPSEKIGKYISYKVRTLRPGWSVQIGNIRPAFPPGLLLHSTDVLRGETLLLESRRLKIRPELLSLFRSGKRIYFQADMYAGEVKGESILQGNPGKDLQVQARFEGIRLTDIAALQQMSEYQISGILSGTLAFSREGTAAKGNCRMKIKDLNVELGPGLFSLAKLTFSDTDAKLNLQNSQNLIIEECVAKGKQMGLNLRGSITLKQVPEKSLLNLSGTIKPHPELIAQLGEGIAAMMFQGGAGKSEFPFHIRGSIEKPVFSMK